MSEENEIQQDSDKIARIDGLKPTKLQGLMEKWFLEYASYVILERAIPNIYDGLKPVQRRILHSMNEKEDGRYNKVANLVGHTMQYHPHGDASIGDALVQMGQKKLLIDTLGNWGNILTGDTAAAPRYIEARLTKFALEVVFNPKTTIWKKSYDGRYLEPETLPIKFPLLLATGASGIAVGLSSKILPHNFIELVDACIDTLQDKEIHLYPDFQTGGLADCSKYNDGLSGGKILVRAKIEKTDKKTLTIREIPFGETSTSIIQSIIKANNLNKIKIKKIDDNTSDKIEITIQLQPGISPDVTIDALFACTKCQVSISPVACVIEDEKPVFLSVTELLQHSVCNTVELLKKELQIELEELNNDWHRWSLEKIFFEKKIYKELEKKTDTWEEQIKNIAIAFVPYQKFFKKEITEEEILKLCEKPVRKISIFDIKKADEAIANIEKKIEKANFNLEHITDYAISYYKHIKEKYSEGRERRTELRTFDTIDVTKVVVANEKLYANFKEGFIGTNLKKDDNAEYICDCSDIDDIIAFRRDGKYIITKISEKSFIGKDIIYVNVFKKNDKRTIYNTIYRDGRTPISYIKRFAVTGITRNKEYDICQGKEGSKVLYFSANPNGEAESIKVILKPKPKLRKLQFEQDFKDIAIRGRDSVGNILSRNEIHKINLKEEGISTLGGRKIFFDKTVLRLNAENRGLYLGDFAGEDKILVIYNDGLLKLSNFDLANHFEENIKIIQKYDSDKVYSAVFFDAEQNFYYLKRFQVEDTTKAQFIIPETEGSILVDISEDKYPQVKITFGGKHENREAEIINVEEFIGIKGITAKGKRLSTFEIKNIEFIEPIIKEDETDNDDNNNNDENSDNSEKDSFSAEDYFNTDNITEQSLF